MLDSVKYNQNASYRLVTEYFLKRKEKQMAFSLFYVV